MPSVEGAKNVFTWNGHGKKGIFYMENSWKKHVKYTFD